jgi:hypothetical protein
MKLIIALIRILFAVYLFAFAGAVVGGFAGLMLAGFQLLAFDHVLWFVEAGAPLFVIWGFAGNGNGGSDEPFEARKPKAKRLFGSSDLFDDGPFIEMPPHCGIWHS